MSDSTLRPAKGRTGWTELGNGANALRPALRGELIEAQNTAYDEARKLYNASIDKKPGAIVRCANVADVIATVQFAEKHDLLLAVRGGGHNGPGFGSCDGGLVADLGNMRGVRVDREAQTVRVEGGATWGQVDHATHAFGLATPSGIISTTGVGGLTLGGGHGYLTRKYGLAVDNLLEADVVLSDGRLVTASDVSHPDLFWALRGGGGNFGVVTSFVFRLHPVSTVVGGPTLWPLDKLEEALVWYSDFMASAPEDLYGFFASMVVPPAPMFPAKLHGQKVCGVVWCYTGSPETADEAFRPVKDFGPTVFEHVGPVPYPALQSVFDGLYHPGLHWYWKGDFVTELPQEAIALHAEYAAQLPSTHSTMHLYPIDGAVHRIGSGDTAWSYRDARWSMVIAGVESDPANYARVSQWARDFWEALHPYSAGGAYLNFMMDEGQSRIQATYRDNYSRLTEVKRKYDPTNLFRVNQNIKARV